MKASMPLPVVITCAVAFLTLCRSSENFSSTSKISNNGECEIYLAPSLTVALGRALIAGNDFASGQKIALSVSLAVRHDDIVTTQLTNYVYGTHEDGISLSVIGLDMIFNHREKESIIRNLESPKMRYYAEQKLAHTTYNNVILSTISNVSGKLYHDNLT